MGKNNYTDDGRHIQLGEQDTVSMPPGFTEADSGTFIAQPFGRVMGDSHSGVGEDYEATDPTD